MKLCKQILAAVFAISLIIICFFSAMDLLLYGCKNYIPNEYAKLGVAASVGVSQEDLAKVGSEMMQYLKGEREHLSDITTTVDGVPGVPFFNERECAHMKDVRSLFLGGMALRRWCAVIAALILLLLIILEKKKCIFTLARGMITGTVVFFVIVGAIAVFAVSDFNAFWTVFHHLFFEGDSWLFDVNTSRMINMLPEQFFADTVIYIILIFAVMMLLLLAAAIVIIRREKIEKEHSNRH